MKQEPNEINPSDKFKSIESDKFVSFNNNSQLKTKELYKKYVKEHDSKPLQKGSIDDKIKNWENEREQMLNKYKRKWESQGIQNESTVIKRSSLQSKKIISDGLIKGLESERLKMLDDNIRAKYDPVIKEPIKVSNFKMGTSINENEN